MSGMICFRQAGSTLALLKWFKRFNFGAVQKVQRVETLARVGKFKRFKRLQRSEAWQLRYQSRGRCVLWSYFMLEK
jgi:hypothetical protein